MTGKEYMETQMAMIRLGKEVEQLDFMKFLVCVSKAMDSSDNMPEVLKARVKSSLKLLYRLGLDFARVKDTMLDMQVTLGASGTMPVVVQNEENDQSKEPANE